jgi:putative alpha-1,2-mannosidase
MKSGIVFFGMMLAAAIAAAGVTEHVDVFVGTQGDHGQLSPAAAVPFGLVKLGPDTEGGGHTGYDYANTTLKGFSHTRVGGVGCSGAGGSLRVKPAFGKAIRDRLDKSTEQAGPGWYHVALANGIVADLTASTRVGFHRYAFPAKQEPVCIRIDPSKSYAGIVDSAWSVRDKTLITGFVKAKNVCGHGYYHLFYAIRFETPFVKAEPDDKGAWCTFVDTTSRATVIQMKVGFSPISIEQAIIEADNEIAGWDFQKARREAQNAWEQVLGRVEVGNVPAELNVYRDLLYTCLYRSYLLPHNVTSSAGQYRVAGDEQTVRDVADTADDYVHYAGWTSWDDFRKYSLISLTEPAVAQNIARWIVEWCKGGHTPQWGSGYWPAPTVRHEFIGAIVADAYFKGLDGFDAEAAYRGVQNTILGNHQLEKPYQYYLAMRMAESLGKTDDAKKLREQAMGYRQYWCPSQTDGEGNVRGFFTKDGKPVTQHEVNRTDAFFYQGNLWHYRYWVPHDMNGLAQLRGGAAALADDLEYYFANCQHMPHNQPPLTYPFLFNYMGRPWRTQYWSRHFITESTVVINESRGLFKEPVVRPVYQKTPDGFMPTMDDDGGSMSSHFVFSALGLYPACMGEPYFVIGSPLFGEVKLRLADNKTFTIKADGASLANKYIQSATLNGKPWDKPWIDYAAIRAGGTLEFKMGPAPNFKWGADPASAPPSLTK